MGDFRFEERRNGKAGFGPAEAQKVQRGKVQDIRNYIQTLLFADDHSLEITLTSVRNASYDPDVMAFGLHLLFHIQF